MTLDDLAELFSGILAKFKKHEFNITSSSFSAKNLRNILPPATVLHTYFSENYISKEIQAVHIGGSHTDALYVSKEAFYFCLICMSSLKGPPAIQ